MPTAPAFERHPELAAPLLARLREDAQADLARAQEAALAHDVKSETHALEGYPAEAICGWLDKHRPDLAVLGSRGLSAQRIHLVGSVGHNVVERASVPTLVARDPGLPRRILAPVDGSEAAARAARWAMELARETLGELTLLFVIPRGTEEVKFTVTQGMARPLLEPLEDEAKRMHVAVAKRVVYGHPAESIVNVADEADAHLVVMGRVGRATPPGFAVGGVTDKVLHRTTRSLAVVP